MGPGGKPAGSGFVQPGNGIRMIHDYDIGEPPAFNTIEHANGWPWASTGHF
jgi:hypothetical protein